ncbi:hypothetical protein N8448_02790 [Gammaproteobacteria bacterium]|nr:hypothetical protein [Gammaproteobacteria bacterium]
MKEYFREICDDQTVYDNKRLNFKLLRIFIRYVIRCTGLKNGLKILNLFSKLVSKRSNKSFNYFEYLLKINIYRVEYLYLLSQSKISDAFSLKKDWANFIINTSISSSSIGNANNYLETIYEKDEVLDESDIKKPNLKKFYIFGPGSLGDPNPKYKDFILVHLKPYPNLLESFKKEILFLNSYTFTNVVQGNEKIISSLKSRYSTIYVTCMTSILPEGFKRVGLKEPGYLSSQMALQRVLDFLLKEYGGCECVIEGFNFYLNEDAYSSKNYLKLTRKKNNKINEQEICLALAEHDFLYNFVDSKKISKKIIIKDSQEYKDIIALENEDYIDKLLKSRDFSTLKNLA